MLNLCSTLDELIKTLDDNRKLLWVARAEVPTPFEAATHGIDGKQWRIVRVATVAAGDSWDALGDGVNGGEGLGLSDELFKQVAADLDNPTSEITRRSTKPIQRAFTYVDISDYSKMPDGLQLLVVHALIQIAEQVANDTGTPTEAKLCIGDGYIYAFDDAVSATRFAANLLRAIEAQVAQRTIPEFHVRIGVHVGRVRWFKDPGRDGWNYVGQGINGGNRVLSAIGKDTDDVVFVSGEVRQAIQLRQPAGTLLSSLHNRGRRADKHGNLWRVYELNHSAYPQW